MERSKGKMSEVKKTARLAAIYAVGIVLEKAASFIMLPIYTRYLTTADYGTIELLTMTIDIFCFIAGVGLAESVFRFYYKYEDPAQRRRVISTAAIMFICFYGIASAIGLLSSPLLATLILEGRPIDTQYFRLIFINLFLRSFITMPLLLIQTQQRPMLFVSVNFCRLVLQLSLNIYFVVHEGLGVIGVLYSIIITGTLVGCILVIYSIKNVGINFSKPMAKELIKFGYPIIVSSLAAFIITFSDRFFIKTFNSLSEVGVYSVGYKFGFLLTVIAAQPIFRIWEPQRFEIARRPDAQNVNRRVFQMLNFSLIAVGLGIALFCHDLLCIMSSHDFWNAYKIVPIILLAYIVQSWTDFNNFGIQWSGKSHYLAIASTVSAFVIIALSFALIPSWGSMGAAWATLLAFLVRFGIVWFYSQREFKLELSWKRNISMLVLATGIYLFAILFFQDSLFLSILIKICLFIVYFCGLFVLRILDYDDRQFVLNFFKNQIAVFRSKG
jgi:O-antigen/teichoic acid export membrane protein